MSLRKALIGLGLGAFLFASPALAQGPAECITNVAAQGTADAITSIALPCGTTTNLVILTAAFSNATEWYHFPSEGTPLTVAEWASLRSPIIASMALWVSRAKAIWPDLETDLE